MIYKTVDSLRNLEFIVFKKNFSSKRKPQKTQDMLNLHIKSTLCCALLSTLFFKKNRVYNEKKIKKNYLIS